MRVAGQRFGHGGRDRGRGLGWGGHGRTVSPEETNETVLKVTCNGHDGVEGIRPDHEDALITLERRRVCELDRQERVLTMNAAFCSFSA